METVEVLIKLPKENPTNGNVIQALYPDATNYGIHDGLVHICLDNRTITTFTSSWWNSPYIGYWGY